MSERSAPDDDGYRWRHFAVAVDEGLLTRAADAFETYVQSADDARSGRDARGAPAALRERGGPRRDGALVVLLDAPDPEPADRRVTGEANVGLPNHSGVTEEADVGLPNDSGATEASRGLPHHSGPGLPHHSGPTGEADAGVFGRRPTGKADGGVFWGAD